MARIRGLDTAPERRLRKLLWQTGLRYRLQWKTPGGRADLAFPGRKLAVFVDGCFWHGCPAHYTPPRSSRPFWSRKLRDNVLRDQRQTARLGESGWSVLRFWEHEVDETPERVATEIRAALAGRRAPRQEKPRVIEVEFLTPDGQQERQHLVSLHGATPLGSVVRERTTTKWRGR